MLENRNWTPEMFRPYAEERRERMRRLRMTASTFSITERRVRRPAPRAPRESPRRTSARQFPRHLIPPPSSDPKSCPPKCLTRRSSIGYARCEVGAMIKLVYIVRKRADISEKDFHEYWLKKHGPLVRSFAKSMRAKKYVQSHTVSEDAGKQIRNTRPKMKRDLRRHHRSMVGHARGLQRRRRRPGTRGSSPRAARR